MLLLVEIILWLGLGLCNLGEFNLMLFLLFLLLRAIFLDLISLFDASMVYVVLYGFRCMLDVSDLCGPCVRVYHAGV